LLPRLGLPVDGACKDQVRALTSSDVTTQPETREPTLEHALAGPFDLIRSVHERAPTFSIGEHGLATSKEAAECHRTQQHISPLFFNPISETTHLFPAGTPGVLVIPSTPHQSSHPSGWMMVSSPSHLVLPILPPRGRLYDIVRLPLVQG
jgi:hypothetical protein